MLLYGATPAQGRCVSIERFAPTFPFCLSTLRLYRFASIERFAPTFPPGKAWGKLFKVLTVFALLLYISPLYLRQMKDVLTGA